MRLELLQIRNALCLQSNEYELTPDVRDYAIPSSLWRKWSPAVKDRALREFLLGNPPFHKVFDVSHDGLTFIPKTFSKLAQKPGAFSRKRHQPPSTIIHRSRSLTAAECVLTNNIIFI